MSDPHKNWLVQKQTALGKDTSNPLMADNLPKIVWYSTHYITLMKSWLVEKKTALGKDTSNPLMADNLPKIVWYSTHYITLMKSWLVEKKTALGKDKSNPLMADNLQKIVWYSTNHITLMKIWLVQKQTALGQTTTGKEISNPFMAEAYCCMFVDDKVSVVKSKFSDVSIKIPTNDVTRLQALVDKKKVVITEATIRDDLRLDDAEVVDCLPNEEIFAKLVGKGFSGVETPLFEGMLVGVIEEGGNAEEHVQDVAADTAAQRADTAAICDVVQDQSIPSPTLPPQQPQDLPSTSRKAEEAKVAGDDQVKGRQVEIYHIDMDHALKVLSMQEDEPKVQEVVDVVTTAKLITEVLTAGSESITTASTTIAAAEPQVPAATITVAPVRFAVSSTKRRKGVVIRDLEEELTTIIPADTKSKDKGKGIMIEEPKPLEKKQHVEMDEEYARKLHEELNKDIDWDVSIDHVKQKAKEDPFVQRYQTKEQIEEEENRAIQSINKTPAQKAAKRRKLNEEVEDLKRHLEIVSDEDDDVYTEATCDTRKILDF
nr:hypothetical protein [Tanacetum cinerariifolium]